MFSPPHYAARAVKRKSRVTSGLHSEEGFARRDEGFARRDEGLHGVRGVCTA